MKATNAFLAIILILSFASCKNDNGEEDPSINTGLIINEIAAHGEYSDSECWIELANTSGKDIDLDRKKILLYDNYFSGKEIWTGNSILAAGEKLVIKDFSNGFCSDGELCIELLSEKNQLLDRFTKGTDAQDKSLSRGGSWQRIPDAGKEWKSLTYASPGQDNKVFLLNDYQNNAIWSWGMYVPEWLENDGQNIKEIKAKGYDHVLLNYYAFESKPELAREFIHKAHQEGLNVHVWMQCFYDENGWVSPVDDDNKCYRQDIYDRILADAKMYIEEFGVKGLHLDYIRFGGTAHKHNYPEVGVTAIGAVTKACKELRELTDSYNEGLVISAAVMPDDDNTYYYYGQNPHEMALYIDIFMPMVYRYYENGGNHTDEWCINGADKFVVEEGNAQCWAGLQTYNMPSVDSKGLDAQSILNDCKVFSEKSKASGIVLFRYGLGELPDVNNLLRKH